MGKSHGFPLIPMNFIADFHVHSKYSRATAKNLDLEHLYIAAQIKGITVIGTGDFTHPAWFSEISEKLVPAEPGLFALKEDLARKCDTVVPDACKNPVRFILTTEISNIYKKNAVTRKNHNLIFLPDLSSAENFNKRLDAIGNIRSDGRPILGLDAKHLLEIMLEENDAGFLVPAHIWTPWFSLLGSKSGFDSLEECFEDLSSFIFAAETGLSSDPAMNWRLSGLDQLTLISNSDAHSPFNLGREANRLNTELSYPAIAEALKTGDAQKFLGTFEFYPEEGKYHFDGHRKCDICFSPKTSMAHQGLCPVCQKPLTIGVLYRVEELADRKEGEKPASAKPFFSIIPLTEILSDIFQVGPGSKKVKTAYDRLVGDLGPELDILHTISVERLNASILPILGEAMHRMRTGQIHVAPGYDGEFGKVTIFSHEEKAGLFGQKTLFDFSVNRTVNRENALPPETSVNKMSDKDPSPSPSPSIREKREAFPMQPDRTTRFTENLLSGLNRDQQEAVLWGSNPLLISAGPGTGKTRTLTHRIAYLIKEKQVSPGAVLALTFTNKAAGEMKERLESLVIQKNAVFHVNTFHGFCNDFLRRYGREKKTPLHIIVDERDQDRLMAWAMNLAGIKPGGEVSIGFLKDRIMKAKQYLLGPGDDFSNLMPEHPRPILNDVYGAYQDILDFQNLLDYEDLVFKTVGLLENGDVAAQNLKNSFSHFFVDEYQDLNYGQYRLIKALSPTGQNLCVIGDPNQAIYGFRGSDPSFFNSFMADFPNTKEVFLTRNYRCAQTILAGSENIIRSGALQSDQNRVYSGIKGIERMGVLCSSSDKSEAVTIGKRIEEMVGGTGFHFMDFGLKGDLTQKQERSFSDFAVLYRTRSQGLLLGEVLEKAGIPCRIADKDRICHEKGIAALIAMLRLVEGCGSIFDFEQILSFSNWHVGPRVFSTLTQWMIKNKLSLQSALAHIRRFPLPGISTTAQLKIDQSIKYLLQLKEDIKDMSLAEKLDYLSRLHFINLLIHQSEKAKESLAQVLNMAKDAQTDTAGFISNLFLGKDTDFYDHHVEKVALMTLHASKGLEFPVVFISGCENDLIPYVRDQQSQTNAAEERRLFYVAMTRAKEDLYFSWAMKRRIHGKMEKRTLSPFVEEIEKTLISHHMERNGWKKDSGSKQLPLF